MSPWCSDLSLVPTAGQEDQVSLIWIKESGRENQGRPRDWAINDLPKVKGLVSSKVKIWTQVFCLNVESWSLYSAAVIHSTSGSALESMAAATSEEGAVLGLCCAAGWGGGFSAYDTHASLVAELRSRSYRLSSCDEWACCSVAYEILVPRLGIEPTSPVLEDNSQPLDHQGRPSSLYL